MYIIILISLCLSGCAYRQNNSTAQNVPLDTLRLEIAELKHELKNAQVEINLLDEHLKKHIRVHTSTLKQSSDLSQAPLLEKKINALELDLRNLNTHQHQTSSKTYELEQILNTHTTQLGEVIKLKSTLHSLSNAISATNSSHTPLTYRVKSGDSLEKIAKNHHTTVLQLKNLNQLNHDKIFIGQELKIPTEK